MMKTNCESCMYYTYDEEYDDYVCDISLDEDDAARLYSSRINSCPFYRDGDEYKVVRKQM